MQLTVPVVSLAESVAYIDKLKPSASGKFFYYCLPFRRSVVHANISQVYGQALSESAQKKLAQSFYSHVARCLRENILGRLSCKSQKKVIVKGHQAVLDVASKQKGVMILTGHFGNWEYAPIAGIAQFQQFKGRFHFIRKLLGNKWLEQKLFRRYYDAGLKVIPKKNSLNQVCDALEQNDAVVFVMDQHASLKAKDGIAVEFFNKKAGTFRSLATIARYTSVPVIPATSYRQANGQHVLEFFPPLPFISHEESKQEIEQNTRLYNQTLEQLILARPDQWLWMHKRWKI